MNTIKPVAGTCDDIGRLTVPRPMPPVYRDALIDVCKESNRTPEEILSQSRKVILVTPRSKWFYNCVIAQGKSPAQMGRYTGFNHTSILIGARRHARTLYPIRDGISLKEMRLKHATYMAIGLGPHQFGEEPQHGNVGNTHRADFHKAKVRAENCANGANDTGGGQI